jgi:hypothetical protein
MRTVRVWFKSPPPISRLSHRDPASGVVSLPGCSRIGQLDPSTFPQALRLRARWAARRLSTSATVFDPRARPDYESPEPRAPHRQSPTCAALPADGYAEPGRPASSSVAVAGARPVESSRVRDRSSGAFAPQSCGTSNRDRSREELCPNPIDPDTSCRMLVTPRVGGP